MDTRIVAQECRTCRGLVATDDTEAVRYYSQSEHKHHVHHADCWRNGKPTERRDRDASRIHTGLHAVQAD